MKETRAIVDARTEVDEALKLLDEADTKIQGLPADVSDDERDFHKNTFERAKANAAEAREKLERAIAIQKAREAVPPMGDDSPSESDTREGFKSRITVDEPLTYRKDNRYQVSFVKDIYASQKGDVQAQERLRRHQMETRDVSTADPGAGVFLPPQYLADMWAELPRESRPFANAIRNMPLPDSGLSITIPRLTTGSTVAVQQTEADAPSETDGDGTLLTVGVRTIAGQQDLSIQAFERTDPSFGDVILEDLRNAYDAYLDTQLLAGTGSNAQHLGIRAVTGRNTVTYTDATPTNGELLGKVYDAIQQIADGRKANPDVIIMHPRRAAWMAAGLSSSFPLFQQGQLMQAAGVQDGGFLQSLAGLRVVIDSNVGVLYGSGTNEDEVYVVRSADLILMEGPLRVRVLEQTLANTLQVKVQVFSYSAFISGRQPEAIGHISGTGLAAPSF
jgi:HK97 family phage major capsid protein